MENSDIHTLDFTSVISPRDKIDLMLMRAQLLKFKNWLECEIITKAERDRPSAYKILSEVKRITGIDRAPERESSDDR